MFLIGWILLGCALVYGFVRLRLADRDARLAEEEGLEPIDEVIGQASIGGGVWSAKRFARLSLYENFLVASARSRRVLMRYDQIKDTDIVIEKVQTCLKIKGLNDTNSKPTDISFICDCTGELKAQIDAKREG